MKPTLILSTLVLALGVAQAGEVFVTKDAQGHPIYTDRPEQLPAQRLDVKSNSTDTVAVQKRYESEMKQIASSSTASSDDAAKKKAEQNKVIDEDRAKRCQEARDRYLKLMNSQRLYEQGPNDPERRYLTDAEMDSAREDGKRVMDEFCGEQ